MAKKKNNKSKNKSRKRVDRVAKALIEASMRLHQRRLWLRMGDRESVLLELEGVEDPIVATVMGSGGEEYGLNLTVGTNAVSNFKKLRELGPDDTLIEETDMIGISVEPLGNIPTEFRGLLEDAGFVGRRDVLAPFVLIKRPGRHARGPNATERKLTLAAIEAILAADDQNDLEPVSWDSGRCLTLTANANTRTVVARIQRVGKPSATGIGVVPDKVRPAGELPSIDDVERRDATWLIGVPPIPPGSKETTERTTRLSSLMRPRSGWSVAPSSSATSRRKVSPASSMSCAGTPPPAGQACLARSCARTAAFTRP